MGKKKSSWQDVDYVLRYFGRTAKSERKAYVNYVEAGGVEPLKEATTTRDKQRFLVT